MANESFKLNIKDLVVTCRQLKRTELHIVHSWMVDEGDVNLVSEHTLKCCYDFNPSAAIGVEAEDGTLVASVYSGNDGDLVPYSLLNVHPNWRKRGIGKLLLEKTLICEMKKRNYYSNVIDRSLQFHLSFTGVEIVDFQVGTYIGEIMKETQVMSISKSPKDYTIEGFTNDTIRCLNDYDASIYLKSREPFLTQWCDPDVTVTQVAMNREHSIIGYGCLQKVTDDACLLGPLYADTQDIAVDILMSLANCIPQGYKLGLHIPLCKPEFLELVHQLGLKQEMLMYRMYSLQKVDINLSKVFGLTNAETALI